jgi:subtilisin family serine protease
MAAPAVAGVVALIKSANPSLPNEAIVEQVLKNCREVSHDSYPGGKGLVIAADRVVKAVSR